MYFWLLCLITIVLRCNTVSFKRPTHWVGIAFTAMGTYRERQKNIIRQVGKFRPFGCPGWRESIWAKQRVEFPGILQGHCPSLSIGPEQSGYFSQGIDSWLICINYPYGILSCVNWGMVMHYFIWNSIKAYMLFYKITSTVLSSWHELSKYHTFISQHLNCHIQGNSTPRCKQLTTSLCLHCCCIYPCTHWNTSYLIIVFLLFILYVL